MVIQLSGRSTDGPSTSVERMASMTWARDV
jgi:hypothetical protein